QWGGDEDVLAGLNRAHVPSLSCQSVDRPNTLDLSANNEVSKPEQSPEQAAKRNRANINGCELSCQCNEV
ncbi:hypothetical protein, partial [Pokkaliibacter plantistimulans]|uniref:hypothetical protein n=1 Tax=Pokkaliibacter plantistimulans TaxID=1635171 RepID=UPI002D76503B